MSSLLGIIPARGGSKRLPKKNILPLAGIPLIGWTIKAAQQAECITEVLVSTDNNEIVDIAKNYGEIIPFIRPDYLATDNATTLDVVWHALDYYQNKGKFFEYVCVLQPTSPLRNDRHIQEAWQLMDKKDADAIVSVCPTEHSPLWANTLPESLNLQNFLTEEANRRSQELPTFYRLNGAIYLAKVSALRKSNSFFMKNSFAYIMPKEFSVDIDDKLDFKWADFLIKNFKESFHEY